MLKIEEACKEIFNICMYFHLHITSRNVESNSTVSLTFFCMILIIYIYWFNCFYPSECYFTEYLNMDTLHASLYGHPSV